MQIITPIKFRNTSYKQTQTVRLEHGTFVEVEESIFGSRRLRGPLNSADDALRAGGFICLLVFGCRFCSEFARFNRLAAAKHALGVVSVTLAEPGRFNSIG